MSTNSKLCSEQVTNWKHTCGCGLPGALLHDDNTLQTATLPPTLTSAGLRVLAWREVGERLRQRLHHVRHRKGRALGRRRLVAAPRQRQAWQRHPRVGQRLRNGGERRGRRRPLQPLVQRPCPAALLHVQHARVESRRHGQLHSGGRGHRHLAAAQRQGHHASVAAHACVDPVLLPLLPVDLPAWMRRSVPGGTDMVRSRQEPRSAKEQRRQPASDYKRSSALCKQCACSSGNAEHPCAMHQPAPNSHAAGNLTWLQKRRRQP